MIDHLDVTPVLSSEQLKALRFRLLNASHGRLIDRDTLITCEGKLKALLLKNSVAHCAPALRALRLMKFNPAKQSRRGAVNQSTIGEDLVLGWMKDHLYTDVLRAGNRDNFFLAMRLIPLLRNMEDALIRNLPNYWQFHLSQAMRLVRKNKTLRTLRMMKDPFERKMLQRWNNTDYYHFMGVRAFSTLTLNHNILFGAHTDGHNVEGTLSCLTALGDYFGGDLCFPRLGVSFALQPGDLLISDTNEEYHGTSSTLVGDRYSIVAYLHGSLL